MIHVGASDRQVNPAPSTDSGKRLETASNDVRLRFAERLPTRSRPEEKLAGLFVHAILVYVILQGVAVAANSGLLKLLANVAAPTIFLVFTVNWLFVPKRSYPTLGLALPLAIYYAGLVGSVLLTLKVTDPGDLTKIMLAPIFLAFGANFEVYRRHWVWSDPRIRLAFGSLIVLPLLVWAWQLATGATSWGGGKELGIFANRNNAGLYVVTLLALYSVISGAIIRVAMLYVFVGVMFGTLGLMLAVVLALMAAVGTVRYALALVVVSASATGLALFVPELGAYSRLQPVIDSVQLIWVGKIDVAAVSYADLVRMLQTTDLSFIFRLKHWSELWSIYQAATPYEWLFGLGIGSSVRMSSMHLVPHNDYVRYLFECGAVTLLGFVWLLGATLRHVGRNWEAVPLLAVTFYFLSENLINNYLAMSIFFYSAGALAMRRRLLNDEAPKR